MKRDQVDSILEQWARERPDLDVSPMAVTGRILRLAAFFTEEMEATFKPFGLNRAGFDLLATLLRSGPPYSLSPNELLASSMVTSGTMTNRIDRLEKAGLISRLQSEVDKRSYHISLTDKGYQLISAVLEAHVETLHRLTQGLSTEDTLALNNILAGMSIAFENR